MTRNAQQLAHAALVQELSELKASHEALRVRLEKLETLTGNALEDASAKLEDLPAEPAEPVDGKG